MFLERIRTLCSKRPGGVKGLAAEVDMSDVNLFRCIREGSIKAQDLERIAKALNVSITEFFPDATVVSDWRIAVARPKKKRLACTNLHISAQCRANTVQAPCKIKDTWLP